MLREGTFSPGVRPKRRAAATLYLLAILVGIGALAGCGGSGQVRLAQLVEEQQSFAGKQVTTAGRVLPQRDPSGETYFVLADRDGDMVGIEPDRRARRYRGMQVVVSGTFSVVPGFGRLLRISSIRRAD